MQIDVTESRAKTMAKSLKKALPEAAERTADITYQQTLDLLARTLGWKTFQTLLSDIRSAQHTPDLQEADDTALFAELRRRGHVLVMRTRIDWIRARYPQLSPADAETLADQLENAVDNSQIPEAFGEIESELAERIRPDEPAGDDRPFDGVELETEVIHERIPFIRTLTRAAFAADPELWDIRLYLTPGNGRAFAEPETEAGPVAIESRPEPALRALVQLTTSPDASAEAQRLYADHPQGDNQVVLVMLRDGHGYLFLDDVPEHGYLGTGDRVGLLIETSGDTEPDAEQVARAEDVLADTWRHWVPRSAPLQPDYHGVIVARFTDPETARSFDIDVTESVTDLSQGPVTAIRQHLKGGLLRWTLRGGPSDKPYRVTIRRQAENFFGKPVERITAEDLMAARRARTLGINTKVAWPEG